MKEHCRDMDQLFAKAKNAPVEMDLAVVEKLVFSSVAAFSLKAFLLHHLNSIIIMTTTIGILTGGIILLWPAAPTEQNVQEVLPSKEELTTEIIGFDATDLQETYFVPEKTFESAINQSVDSEPETIETIENSNLVGTDTNESTSRVAKVEDEEHSDQTSLLEPKMNQQLRDVGQFNTVALAINIKVVLKK